MFLGGAPARTEPRANLTGARLFSKPARYLIAGVFVVQACASVPARVDANDPCSIHRKPMVEAQERFNDTIAGNVVAGAVIGGIIGGLVTGDVGGAIGGAIAGGLAGAAKGYLDAKSQQAQNRAQVLSAINQDVRSSRAYIGQISEGVRRLQTCRANEIADLQRRIQQRAITGGAARTELATLRNRIADDRRLFNAVMGDVDENTGVYASALAQTQGVDEALVVSNQVSTYQPVIDGPIRSTRGARNYAQAGVNVRSGPGTSYSKIGAISKGQSIGVLGAVGGGWTRVDASGRDGYVASKYIGPNRPANVQQQVVVQPKADRRSTPRTSSEVEELYIQKADLKAGYDVYEQSAVDLLDSTEALIAD